MKLSLLPEVEALDRPHVCARYTIASPMYLHGVDSTQVIDRILPQSVKGALRFWWRAVHWADFYREVVGDTTAALKALAEADARLWGAADESIGQGKVLISVDAPLLTKSESKVPLYLLGLGLKNQKDQGKGVGQSFEVTCHFRSTGEELEQDQAQVLKTLKAWGLLGGLGARARHGLGSVQIQSLYQGGKEVECFNTSEDAQRAIQILFQDAASVMALPPYTALSAHASCHVLQGRSVMKLLNETATKLSKYRKDCKEDKSQVMQFAESRRIEPNYPKRAVFGLPQNYRFNSNGKKFDVTVEGYLQTENKKLRRASPLFIHAGQFGNEAHIVLTLLPAAFLPEGGQLQLKAGGTTGYNDFAPDWNVIKAFMYDTLDTRKVWPK